MLLSGRSLHYSSWDMDTHESMSTDIQTDTRIRTHPHKHIRTFLCTRMYIRSHTRTEPPGQTSTSLPAASISSRDPRKTSKPRIRVHYRYHLPRRLPGEVFGNGIKEWTSSEKVRKIRQDDKLFRLKHIPSSEPKRVKKAKERKRSVCEVKFVKEAVRMGVCQVRWAGGRGKTSRVNQLGARPTTEIDSTPWTTCDLPPPTPLLPLSGLAPPSSHRLASGLPPCFLWD